MASHFLRGLQAGIFSRGRQRPWNLDQVNVESRPVSITSTKGKGAVLVGEDDWAAIEETLALVSIPGMAETLAAGHAEALEDCAGEDELDW